MTDREKLAMRTMIVTVLLLLAATTMLFAQVQQKEITKRFMPAPDRALQINVRGDGAEISVAAARQGREGRARYRFTPENFEGTLDWDPEENRLTAILEVRNMKFEDEGEQTSDLDVLVPRSVPLDLDVDLKGGVFDLDGAGLSFENLRIALWGGELSADFPEPSTGEVKMVEVDVKMGETNVSGLGNLAFDRLDVNGFAGEMTLDFTGTLKRRRAARIDLEFGSITVIVPRGTGVEARIGKWGFLSDVTVPSNWGRDGRYAYSPAAEEGVELELDIRGGVGEIIIIER